MDKKLGLKNFKDGKLQASSHNLSSQYRITCFLARGWLAKQCQWVREVILHTNMMIEVSEIQVREDLNGKHFDTKIVFNANGNKIVTTPHAI